MKKRILFYSSVTNKSLFVTQKFYKIDIDILRELDFDVVLSNKITDFLYFWRYDIAFIYFYKFGFFVSLLARIFGKSVYFTGGIDDLDQKYASSVKYFIQKFFFRLCYLLSTKCILVSSADVNNVKNIFYGKLPRKTVISYHAFEVEKFLCSDSSIKGYDFLTIAWMGNTENVIRKGIDIALRLFKLLQSSFETYKQSRFIIIGKMGDGSDYLAELCSKLDIVDKVIFTDEIDEETKISYLKSSKYYMQLSLYEGFGIAAAEALVARNIVINSGRGGLVDSVGNHGVKVDVEVRLENQLIDIHNKIECFNSDLLDVGEKYIVDNFSYNLRVKNFKNIIS